MASVLAQMFLRPKLEPSLSVRSELITDVWTFCLSVVKGEGFSSPLLPPLSVALSAPGCGWFDSSDW